MDMSDSQSPYSQTKQTNKNSGESANFTSFCTFISSTREQRATKRARPGEQADTERSAHLEQFPYEMTAKTR